MKRLLFVLPVVLAMTALPISASVPGTQPIVGTLHWRNIGPYIGGRVVALSGVADRPNLFYMGAVDGGVWKSTDYGIRWTNITDGQLGSSESIGAIAVAPSNDKVLYAGTGESDIRGTLITGDGIYRSRDGGKTWSYAGLRDTRTTSGIVVDPRDASVVYASSMGHVFKANPDRGVFKSTDGGASWHKVLFVNDETGAISLAMDQKHPNVLYAAMWQAYRTPWLLSSGGPGSGLYKTIDGGAHWTKISSNPGFARGVLGRMGVSVSPTDPNVVYAIVQAKDGGVFRSSNGGATWTRVNDEWKLRQRAFYYMTIYVDPQSPNTVYAPEVDGVYVSRDGGRAFSLLHPPHGDNHIIWVNPHDTNILLEGNDGGATVSTDGGATWSTEWNQPTGQFYHVSIDDRFPFHVYGAQQDEGSLEGPSASASGAITIADWKRVAYGESTFVAPQPGNPDVTYGSGYFSILMRYDQSIAQYQGISPWPRYREGASSAELEYRFGWTHPILFSPNDPKELLVASQYVLRSDDYGQTWRKISPDLTRNVASTQGPSGGPIDLDQSGAEVFPDISALAVSPLDNDLIWAGSADGLVHVTTDGGTHWQAVTPPQLPQWAEITSIEPSHAAKQTAYLTASRYMWDDQHPYVYETTDGGAHWSAIAAGLPHDEYAFTVRQDPKDDRLLFLGTKSGVYVSYDGGARWEALSLNLPRVQVRDVAIDNREGAVAIATHGRAFWVLDDLSLLEQLTHRQPNSSGVQLFAPATAWLTHAYGSSPYPIPDAGENRPFGTTVFFTVPRDYTSATHATLTFSDASGAEIRSFTLHPRPLHTPSPALMATWSPAQRIAYEAELHTSIVPGANAFSWNLRYPDATEVTGFYPPAAAGGLEDTPRGPEVVPGTYAVTLRYGGTTLHRSFTVALDPRITVDARDLVARRDLGLRIRATLDTLDRTINDALAARDHLNARLSAHAVADARARAALHGLDAAIGNMVQLDIHSSEGTLLHESKLRSHLAYLANEIGLAYAKPTTAQYAVFDQLDAEATAGEAKLRAAIAAAGSVR